jgi:hypothetical protein
MYGHFFVIKNSMIFFVFTAYPSKNPKLDERYCQGQVTCQSIKQANKVMIEQCFGVEASNNLFYCINLNLGLMTKARTKQKENT